MSRTEFSIDRAWLRLRLRLHVLWWRPGFGSGVEATPRPVPPERVETDVNLVIPSHSLHPPSHDRTMSSAAVKRAQRVRPHSM